MRTDLDDTFAVRDRGLFGGLVEFDIGFDEFCRSISTRHHRLDRSTCKPVNHRASCDQTEEKGRMEQGEVGDEVGLKAVGEENDDGEDEGRCSYHSGTDEYRFGRGLEGVSGPIALLQE